MTTLPDSSTPAVEGTQLDDGLMAYFAEMDRWRAERVEELLAAMTKRERALVREVAVMAGVRGRMAGAAGHSEAPPDSAVLADAVLGCLSMSDLYPTVARLERAGMRRARRLRESGGVA